MPELPEVEVVRTAMEKEMRTRVIENVEVRRRDLRVPISNDFESVFAGQRVDTLVRRGKYIIVSLENARTAVLHLGMSGRIFIHPPDYAYEPAKHDHVILNLNGGGRVVFQDPRRFGMFYLTPANWSWDEQAPFSRMGPEPLSNDFHGEALWQRLRNKKTPIKTALLDQNVVAGVGNIYACEALFMAQIHPETRARDVPREKLEDLARAIRDVLQKAIAAGGSTLRDYHHTDGSLGYFQYSFSVYDREGEACTACKDVVIVRRIVQSGRSTFFCPVCQEE